MPLLVQELPTICPLLLMPFASLTVPPSVPRILHRPVVAPEKCVPNARAGVGVPHDLAVVVDGIRLAIQGAAERAEVLHRPAGTPRKSVAPINAAARVGRSHDLPAVVDGIGLAAYSTERAKVQHRPVAVQESMVRTGGGGPTHYLSAVVDAGGVTLISSERADWLSWAVAAVQKTLIRVICIPCVSHDLATAVNAFGINP